MVFSSQLFLFYFFPFALLVYYALAKAPQRAKNLCLAILGYIFYGWANPKFIFLMFGTTFLDWMMSIVIAYGSWRFWKDWKPRIEAPLPPGERTKVQRSALVLSIVSNLVVLGFFKYFNFFLESYNGAVADVGMAHLQWDTYFRVILPLGISFYTFQSLSYIIDVYRGDAKAMRNFIDFSCFVSMFPHLVAGPILKFSFLADQLEGRRLTMEKFARGAAFFMLGMGKKVLIANPCGKVADLTFNAHSVSVFDSWFGAINYAFQIFLDFSAYSDMAIGLGLMFGFVFARNFDAPYRSTSVTEFWRRWHISLSTWLREYLYIPLGGNRKGKTRNYINLFLTMLLGGLWHGASWNFIIWGALHGTALAVERGLPKESFYWKLPALVRGGATFLVVLIGWVFFRASDLPKATSYLATMFGFGEKTASATITTGLLYKPYYLLAGLVATILVWFLPDAWEWTQVLTKRKAFACAAVFVLAIVILVTQEYNPFIYFIF
ncbi:MBOAT family O-acyltransferase [Fimbriimonas ginsengisoli]|uniref:Membrane bound O-acyl transferase MBOAT family protein n=1 Tax=Fimbriimonas ginsengisoli Gsoil 348 TaxID=661478 RepID=A0A068NNL7_FIMGI|nr:MBOAT family O-acyltransferase [Fimbriimonas ginsengisoli]AIE85143.1 membrane bound O-acyl transferase MBOAT family protein [Fimbriimonas ginsengisoli Gsoil 348]